MTIHSKNKGCAGEREVRDLIVKAGFPARRGQQFSGGADSPDVVHDMPLEVHIEVKRVERLELYPAFEQAVKDGPGKIPTVWHRRSKKPWLVVMSASDFLDLVKRVGVEVGVEEMCDFLE